MVVGIWVLDVFRLGGSLALQKEAMGAGDPKLAALMGMWLGWEQILLTLFLASFLGTIAGLVIAARQQQSQPYPFGPFLAIGGLISLLAGQEILGAYSRWLGLTF
jgi:leader peptidase (prepilin peptidase)/N-methyltransferase